MKNNITTQLTRSEVQIITANLLSGPGLIFKHNGQWIIAVDSKLPRAERSAIVRDLLKKRTIVA